MKLQGDVTVTAMQRLPGQIQVSLIRTASPGDGTLTLIFADNPLTLRQWTVLDAQRQETRVTLYNVETGGKFDQKLFELVDPRFFQPNPSADFGILAAVSCRPSQKVSSFCREDRRLFSSMKSSRVVRPLVGISCCTKQFGIFGMPNHAASNTYVEATDHARARRAGADPGQRPDR